ncbi:hypothetical protein ACLOJK_006656, partial [Asimina triloba]
AGSECGGSERMQMADALSTVRRYQRGWQVMQASRRQSRRASAVAGDDEDSRWQCCRAEASRSLASGQKLKQVGGGGDGEAVGGAADGRPGSPDPSLAGNDGDEVILVRIDSRMALRRKRSTSPGR